MNRTGIIGHNQLTMASEAPMCCWNRCEAPPDVEHDVPLCATHLRKAWAVHQTMIEAGEAPERTALRPPNQPRTLEGIGWVYFAHVGPHIKIGWTSNLNRRMQSLGGALYASIPNKTREDEKAMHHAFAACRDRTKGREYFHPAPALMNFIRDLQTHQK